MNNNLEDQINAKFAALVQAKNASKHLQHVQDHITALRRKAEHLKTMMQSEHDDVVALEKASLKQLFLTVLGNHEERLEIERQEYMQALLRYRSTAEEIELAVYEHDLLYAKHQSIPKLEKELHSLLQIKEQKLRFMDRESARQLKDYNLVIDLRKSRIVEIKEAKAVGDELARLIDHILDRLRKVRQFGRHLMQGQGRYSSYHKKTYIDQSQQMAVKIHALLQRFEHELQDIFVQYKHDLHIDQFSLFLDHFYENLITDWVIQTKLNSAITGTEQVGMRLERMRAMIAHEQREEEAELARVTAEKRQFLLDKSAEE